MTVQVSGNSAVYFLNNYWVAKCRHCNILNKERRWQGSRLKVSQVFTQGVDFGDEQRLKPWTTNRVGSTVLQQQQGLRPIVR